MDPITPTSGQPGATGDSSDDDALVASGARTVEEVEAFWRNRVSQKDKAHAAERKALRDQLASYQQGATSGTGQQGGDGSAAEIERLRREIAIKDVLYDRKVKYPNLVANGVSDATIAAADEGELAKFNSLFDDTAARGTFIAPTAPRKAAPVGAKPLNEMSKDELKDRLRQQVDREQAARRGY